MKQFYIFFFSFLGLTPTFLVHAAEAADRYYEDVARRELRVWFDCNGLRDTRADCVSIKLGFFSDYGRLFRDVDRPSDADISLELTNQNVVGAPTIFMFKWSARPEMNIEPRRYTVEIDTRQHDSVSLTQSLIDQAIFGASAFLKLVRGKDEGDTLVLKFAPREIQETDDTGEQSPSKKKNSFNSGPFFFDLSVSASGGKSQISSTKGSNLGASVNYSQPKVRIMLDADRMTTHTSVTTSNGEIKASNQTLYLSFIGAYTFQKRWSLALIGMHYSNPGDNIRSMRDLNAGIEWSLVPIRIDAETREVYVRGAIGRTELELKNENELGWKHKVYPFVTTQLYTFWGFVHNKINVSASAQLYVYPSLAGYQRYSANVTGAYQITPSIRIRASYNASYRKRSLIFPAETSQLNPYETSYLQSAPGTNSSYSFSLSFSGGNRLRRSRDRRWTGF